MHVRVRVAISACVMSCVIVFLAWPEFLLCFQQERVPSLLFFLLACRTLGCENPFVFQDCHALSTQHACQSQSCNQRMCDCVPGLA